MRKTPREAVEASGKLFQVARNGRARGAAEKSGAIGALIKERLCRLVLLRQTPEEREETMDILFMAAITRNGCGRLVDAIKKYDADFIEQGKERLAKAKTRSTAYPSRDDVIQKPDDGRSEDHLFGNTK